MSRIECRKCGEDLEARSTFKYLQVNYCPNCGTKPLKKQRDVLYRKTSDEDIDDHVRGNLLDMFDNYCGDLRTDELAECAWESESCDGAVFCSNYEADNFVMRHTKWVDEALEYIGENFGDYGTYTRMKAECNDKFLVVAFIEATRKYLYDQIGIGQDEGKLSRMRINAIKKVVKETPYDCEW